MTVINFGYMIGCLSHMLLDFQQMMYVYGCYNEEILHKQANNDLFIKENSLFHQSFRNIPI